MADSLPTKDSWELTFFATIHLMESLINYTEIQTLLEKIKVLEQKSALSITIISLKSDQLIFNVNLQTRKIIYCGWFPHNTEVKSFKHQSWTRTRFAEIAINTCHTSYSTNTKTEFSTHAMGKETAMWRSQWTLLQTAPPNKLDKSWLFFDCAKKNQQKCPLQGLVGSNVGIWDSDSAQIILSCSYVITNQIFLWQNDGFLGLVTGVV